MSPLVFPKWTIVQHSGYGYSSNPQFEHAVETRVLANNAEVRTVNQVGGLVLDSYMEAEDFCDKANYPEGNSSIIPTARGTFSHRTIDGLKIYIPLREATG